MNSSANHQLRTPALAALAIATCVHGAFAQSPRFRALAASGDTATGVTGTAWYRAFTSGFVNEAGTAAFAADIDGIALPNNAREGLWIADPASESLGTLVGDGALLSSVSIRSLDRVLGVRERGDAFVSAQLASYLGTGDGALRVGSGSGAVAVLPRAYAGFLAPTTSYRFDTLDDAGVGSRLTFLSGLSGGGWANIQGLFQSESRNDGTSTLLFEGATAPLFPSGWTVADIVSLEQLASGPYIAATRVTNSQLTRFVLYAGNTDVPTEIKARSDTTYSFQGSSYRWTNFTGGWIAPDGPVAISGFVVINNASDAVEGLLLLDQAGQPTAFVGPGQSVFDGIATRSIVQVEADVALAQNSIANALVLIDSNSLALIRASSPQPFAIAAEGGSIPDGPGSTLLLLQTAAAAPNGDIAWTGAISTPNLGIGEALYLAPADGSPQRRLLASGDPIPGPNGITLAAATIRLLGNAGPDRLIARGGLTTSGFALVRVGFADGTQSLLLVDTLCPADVDRSRTVDLADLFAFFDAYDRRDWPADITADGSIDLADFFAFFEGFDTGCE